MTYNPGIPNATDLISNSQSQLKTNFTTIDTGAGGVGSGHGFNRNHQTITDNTNGGLHSRVDFYQNQSAPSISGFVSSLYPRLFAGLSQLFFKNSNNEVQLSNLTLTTGGTGLNVWYGISTPWGIVLNWGIASPAFPGATITFPVVCPTKVDAVIATPHNNSGSASATVANESASGFTVFTNVNNAVWWFAIGH